MQIRRWLFFLVMTATGLLTPRLGRAQCLPLERLDKGVAAGRITPDSLQALFSLDEMVADKWVEHPGEEPYWTFAAPGLAPAGEAPVEAWVGLRRSNQHDYYDLVYKTTRRECVTQLRAELRRRGKLKSEFINCVQCEGERLVGKDYTVTVFAQKKAYAAKSTAFPFVLVVRRNGAAGSVPESSLQVFDKP